MMLNHRIETHVTAKGDTFYGVCEDHGTGAKTVRWYGQDKVEAEKELRRITDGPTCRECSCPRSFGCYTPSTHERLDKRGLCFHCDFWTNYANTVSDATAIIDGRAYSIGEPIDTSKPAYLYGHGGAFFRIEFTDGRTVETRNLWANGIIPAHFRDRLTDNARFAVRSAGSYCGEGAA